MSAEELVRTFWEEVVNGRRLDLIDELFAEDYCLHAAFHALEARSRDDFKRLAIRLCTDAPRMQVRLNRLVVNGREEVDAVWTVHTERAELDATRPEEAEEIVGATVFLVENGRITGAWAEWRNARSAA